LIRARDPFYMDDLGIDFAQAVAWFAHDQDQPFVLVRISPESVADLSTAMCVPLRRCYITDALIDQAAAQHGLARAEIVRGVLPDAGAVMSGDFGEVLTYFYQASRELPADAFGPKKWRLKQDRTKPAPKSDVVHFVMPNRPRASAADSVLCSEVKAKATAGGSTPIADAIIDCKKDRTSRLASTLVWLRERAMTTDLGDVDIPLLDRFIDAVDSPPATKRFRAVAVICNALLDGELVSAPDIADPEFTLVVIGVPDLRTTYTAIYNAAIASVA
jgi:Cap4 SAVED domain